MQNKDTADFERRSDGEARRSNIVIIGAGSRVAGDLMHALGLLQDEYSVVGVYARHAGTLAGASDTYAVSPLGELSEPILQKARFVYVAVPTKAVAEVLTPLPDGIELILDTPVPLSRKLYRRLRRFSKVHVAEDSVCMPWLAEARTKFGRIRRVECWRSVSRCHGIAIVKTLCGPIRWGWRWGNTIHLRAGDARVRITEPRDYKRGTLSINGNQLDVVSQMHRHKREGLVRMLRAIHLGETPWPLDEGRNDELVDRLLHTCWVYIALKRLADRGLLPARA